MYGASIFGDIIINPHPVMSPDLHGPPAGPRRPGAMTFKYVEFLVQLKKIKTHHTDYYISQLH